MYVGTTDTDFDGPMDEPLATGDDIDYILEALNQSLDTSVDRAVTRDDITGVWAGLRPLVKQAAGGIGRRTRQRRRISPAVTQSGPPNRAWSR